MAGLAAGSTRSRMDPQRTSGERDRFDGNKNVAAGGSRSLLLIPIKIVAAKAKWS